MLSGEIVLKDNHYIHYSYKIRGKESMQYSNTKDTYKISTYSIESQLCEGNDSMFV